MHGISGISGKTARVLTALFFLLLALAGFLTVRDYGMPYDEYTEKIGTVAKNLNFDPTPAPQFALTMAGMGIRFKMATDRTNTHIAKIMLQGTLNGLIDLYRLTNKLDEVHPEIALLTRQVLKYEEGQFEWMKGQL